MNWSCAEEFCDFSIWFLAKNQCSRLCCFFLFALCLFHCSLLFPLSLSRNLTKSEFFGDPKISKSAMNTVLQEWIPSFNIRLTGGCLPQPNWLVKSYPSTEPTFRACLFSLFNPSKLILPQAFLFKFDGIFLGPERSNEITAPSK